jgi:hypothetical protein
MTVKAKRRDKPINNLIFLNKNLGKMEDGTPKSLQRKGSHSRVSRFMSMVRLALVTSVRWRPPVRFQSSHVSTVPNRRRPWSQHVSVSGTFSNNLANKTSLI